MRFFNLVMFTFILSLGTSANAAEEMTVDGPIEGSGGVSQTCIDIPLSCGPK
jgi:hypothetical protein